MENQKIREPLKLRGCDLVNDPPIWEQLNRVQKSINNQIFNDKQYENTIRRANYAAAGAGR